MLCLLKSHKSVGSNPGCNTCVLEQGTWPQLLKIGEVVHSALLARLQVDDTHAYILKDCEGGNPVSALGVGGYGPW